MLKGMNELMSKDAQCIKGLKLQGFIIRLSIRNSLRKS